MLTVTRDSCLSSIDDDFKSYNNINLNGYILYVNKQATMSTEYDENSRIDKKSVSYNDKEIDSVKNNDKESFSKTGYKTIGFLGM